MATMTAQQIADDAIGLFIEYRDRHGYDEDRARAQAVIDVIEGASVDVDALHAEMAAALTPNDNGYTTCHACRGFWHTGDTPKHREQCVGR